MTMRNPYSLAHRTRVFKFNSLWTVQYYWPYSGVLIAQYNTWQEAMDEACGIEKNRGWE